MRQNQGLTTSKLNSAHRLEKSPSLTVKFYFRYDSIQVENQGYDISDHARNINNRFDTNRALASRMWSFKGSGKYYT